MPSDSTDELLTVTGLFNHFYSLDTTIAERQFFKRLAQLIGTRAARLSACGIAAIVSKMGYLEEGCGVATDGSLYNVRLSSFTFRAVAKFFHDRNTRNSLNASEKVSWIFSVKRESEFFLTRRRVSWVTSR